jgi:demethylmenaquinone methyltransferase/2-methoxy-6-polyprenyl-1,4-benzoquinol methylase
MLSPKARQIRQMFSSIAPRYDLLNHLLSLNIDKSWRRKAVSLMRRNTHQQQDLWLDLCCGTGDLSLEMVRQQGASRIVSSDFSHPMLCLHLDKLNHRDAAPTICVVEADALSLPFPANTFDALAIAFGLRNLESPESGLAEMNRVLKPGGRVVVLEFSKPTNALFNRVFQKYFFNVLPRIGAALSHHTHAYTYLPESVSQFPDQARLAAIFTACDFEKVGYVNLTGGIAAIHWGDKK